MPLDAFCIAAVRDELETKITGMKIDKVQQPERDMIILTLRGKGSSHRLLISAGSGDARIHLTEHQFENPASPPMFCMLLRKHLIGARIVSVKQPPAERIIELTLDAPDAMGVVSEKILIIELIGRLSNIILTGADGINIDCLRRVGGDLTERRVVLPGLIYRYPPQQEGKLDPLKITLDQWKTEYASASDMPADKWILSRFSSMSPLICRELVWRAYGDIDIIKSAINDNGEALRREFFSLMQAVREGNLEPWRIAGTDNEPRDFSFTKVCQYGSAINPVREDSFSVMLDSHFTSFAKLERIRQRASDTTKTVKTARDRLVRKLAAQREELYKTGQREEMRECGDIITANIHRMRKGQSELVAQDFYSSDGCERRISLDPQKTPQQNAATYYKRYTKAKTAEKYLSEQILKGENELKYLESVLGTLELAEGERDLSAIRNELEQTGYIKSRKQTKDKPGESAPLRFESSTGHTILAGRNNTQNDLLTLKKAAKSDIWLHVQKAHGAHVILVRNGGPVGEEAMLEAAAIAAYYSTARGGGKVAVDHALVKNVKKPSEARPGMVVYTDYKTIIVTPDEALVSRLRRS